LINKYSNVPLYSQLKNIIIKKIESGEFKEDDQIPSEQELCEKYNISRPTVRQAINELTSHGYLYKERGKGTFVAKSKKKHEIIGYTGFTTSILDKYEPDNFKIISVKKVTAEDNPKLESIFESVDNHVRREGFSEIKYLESKNDSAISLNLSYIPLAFFPNLIDDINENKPSYEILKGKYPLLPVKSKSKMEIVYTTQEDAQYLQVQTGCALIKFENKLFSKTGQVVEYNITKYTADKCNILFEHTK